MIDIKKIEQLMKLMNENGFEVAQAQSQDEVISLSKKAGALMGNQFGETSGAQIPSIAPSQNYGSAPTAATAVQKEAEVVKEVAQTTSEPTEAKEEPIKGEVVKSPFVGTFYLAPSPDAENFVNIGDRVKVGDTLCIVEAMKIMNEIESESAGVVAKVLVENAQPVEFGTPLFIIQ